MTTLVPPIRLGIIGIGYWGGKLLSAFLSLPEVRLVYVCDINQSKMRNIPQPQPKVYMTTDARVLIRRKDIDAVVVATPLSFHFELAKRSLQAQKHVFVEKPMTETAEQADVLIRLASKNHKTLFVDHTVVYSTAARHMKQIIDSRAMGKLYTIQASRCNLGMFQPDCDVVWDLAPHDVSLLCYILKATPVTVSAVGQAHLVPGVIDTAWLQMKFSSGVSASLFFSWLWPRKERRMTLVGSQKMMEFDDMYVTKKIRVSNTKAWVSSRQRSKTFRPRFYYQHDAGYTPRIKPDDPLRTACHSFISSIQTHKKSLSGGREGRIVVATLMAATQSLLFGGREIKIRL